MGIPWCLRKGRNATNLLETTKHVEPFFLVVHSGKLTHSHGKWDPLKMHFLVEIGYNSISMLDYQRVLYFGGNLFQFVWYFLPFTAQALSFWSVWLERFC